MKVMNFNNSTDDLYKRRLQGWTDREIQLSRLHEEIVAKREALVHYSMTYVEAQLARRQTAGSIVDTATKRNDDFLGDLDRTEDKLYQEACNPPSPRLVTLQNNYWSMVKSLKPLWEQSLLKKTTPATKKATTRPSKPRRIMKKKVT